MISSGRIRRVLSNSPTWQIVGSVLAAATVLGIFLVNRYGAPGEEKAARRTLSEETARLLDREVDSVLVRCRIEKRWIKRLSAQENTRAFAVVERRVAIPADVLPVQVNVAMNSMARRYDARVIAYENVKENTVTLHIEYDGRMLHKIILKTTPNLQRTTRKHVATTT